MLQKKYTNRFLLKAGVSSPNQFEVDNIALLGNFLCVFRLKYKLYQRVAVNESNQAEGELPAAESCVPDEDEEFGEVNI